jgi:HD-GYP domain-containing protein (c-di-GMP phosphodiesterase class II)
MVRYHHEYFDGTGYPGGLKGNEIPLGSRLFMVADVFDALTSNRPYQKAISYEKATEIIKEKSGNHFDPAIVETFQKIPPSEWEEIKKLYPDENINI